MELPFRDLDEEVRVAVRRKVDGLRVTLWLDWDISQPQRKEAAIQYMTEFVLDVLDDVFHE